MVEKRKIISAISCSSGLPPYQQLQPASNKTSHKPSQSASASLSVSLSQHCSLLIVELGSLVVGALFEINQHKLMARRRILVALDFDHTIVEENSDIVARKLIHADLIPENVRRLYQTKGWTDYMSEIFKLLHKHKVSKETIIKAMHNMTPTQKMPEFLRWLKREDHEAIIISDSNSVFIDAWLRQKDLDQCIIRVFTNPASFNEDGLLLLKPYHEQDSCKLSTRNLCKGFILETYIKEREEEGVTFDLVSYIGDGQNDLCPALRLGKDDFVFPRIGFTLDNILKEPKDSQKVIAGVRPWISAAEILSVLQSCS